jgi:hypothetical protein
MQPILIPTSEVLNYIVKPITELNGNPMSGAVGTRRVAAYLGVKDGDPLSAFTLPDFVIQKRPTTSAIDAGTVTPFGNPSASKQSWSLNKQYIQSRFHSEVLTSDIGLPTYGTTALPPEADTIINNISSMYSPVISKDLVGTAFWSHTTFDPASDYTGTHDFPSDTIASYQNDNGFMKQLTTALAASAFSNYKTTTGTGGIDVDGATLSAANAAILMEQMLLNAPRKLRNLNSSLGAAYKPYFTISDDFFNALKSYVSSTFSGVGSGYLIFADGKDGRPDMNTVLGLMYKGYQVFNGGSIFDEYWEHTNPASTFNHMGYFTARENLSIGINLRSPNSLLDGGAGLSIYRRPEPEMLGAVDLTVYMESDYLISDTSLFSTVGLEQAP